MRCGRLSTRNFITDPLIVVEVLSPSTIDVDRGRKLRFYKNMPTAMHIALAYADQMRIEHYRRVPKGWQLDVLTSPQDELLFDAVDFGIELRQIYFDLPL